MKRKYFGLLSVALLLVALNVQSQTLLRGQVSDQNEKPLPLVTLVLSTDSVTVAGITTDDDGRFQLHYPFIQGNRYTLSLSLIGYQPFTKSFIYPDTNAVSLLQLLPENTTMAGVTVSARRALITQKVDRLIVNVENSFLAYGNSGLEVLQKSPGIWVSSDGSIQLKGGQTASIMINHVLQRMTGEDLADYLKTLKSEDIARIEIIHNPPADFEAAGTGGIIHILLKKGRKDGLSGSINSQYRSQEGSPFGSGGASVDYKIKSVYFFGSGSLAIDKNTSWGQNHIRYPDKSFFESTTDRKNRNRRQQYRIGIGYDISPAHTIGLQLVGTSSQLFHDFYTATHYQSYISSTTGHATSNWVRKPALTSTTLNYSWKIDTLGTMLKFIGDFTSSTRRESNHFSALFNEPSQNNTYRIQTPNDNRNNSAQVDFVKMLPKQLELNSGFKYSHLKRDNEVLREDWENGLWIMNTGVSNHFLYHERLLMGYASAAKALKQTTIKAGLRIEETYSKGYSLTTGDQFTKKYLGLFPTFYIMQSLNKGNSIYLIPV